MDKSVREINYEDHAYIAQMCGGPRVSEEVRDASRRYQDTAQAMPRIDLRDLLRKRLMHICNPGEAPLEVENLPKEIKLK